MVQMALQSRAVVPDGTASVSSIFIILQGEERERAVEWEKVGEWSEIQEPIKEPQLALIPPAGHSLSSSHLKVVLFSFSDFSALFYSHSFPSIFSSSEGGEDPLLLLITVKSQSPAAVHTHVGRRTNIRASGRCVERASRWVHCTVTVCGKRGDWRSRWLAGPFAIRCHDCRWACFLLFVFSPHAPPSPQRGCCFFLISALFIDTPVNISPNFGKILSLLLEDSSASVSLLCSRERGDIQITYLPLSTSPILP